MQDNYSDLVIPDVIEHYSESGEAMGSFIDETFHNSKLEDFEEESKGDII